MLIEECERQVQSDQETHKHEDKNSVKGEKSRQNSVSSRASLSTRKKKVRVVLLAKKELELAKRRAA